MTNGFFLPRFHLLLLFLVCWRGKDGDVWSQTADGGMYRGTMPFTDTDSLKNLVRRWEMALTRTSVRE